jgi:hypothetical protein
MDKALAKILKMIFVTALAEDVWALDLAKADLELQTSPPAKAGGN